MTSRRLDPTKRKSICFVSETGRIDEPLQDPSVRYRCYHFAEALLPEGHDCTIISGARFFENPLTGHDIYLFHRPNSARTGFTTLLDALRKQGSLLIADYDDLIFGNEDLALVSSAVKNGTLTPQKAISAFRSNLIALRKFDKISTSTEQLAKKAKEYNDLADVVFSPNFIPESILSIHREKRTALLQRPATTIGYFAGTRSHDRDFPVVEAALHRALCENPNLTFLIVGPVTVPHRIAQLPNVSTAPAVNFLRLTALMSMCATVIAPLEMTEFNACKSRVKFLEAALAGARLIASPIPDMKAIGLKHIAFAENSDDWYQALSTPLHEDSRIDLAELNFAAIETAGSNIAIRKWVNFQ